MGILINDSQIGGDGSTSNSFHNIGEIFYTMRTDTILNGAVECDGSQYNFTDFPDIKNLLDEGKLPYVSIGEFDSMVTNQGVCGSFGHNESGTFYGWSSTMQGDWYTKSETPQVGDDLFKKQYDVMEKVDTVYEIREDPYRIVIDADGHSATRETSLDETIPESTYFKVPKLSNIFIESGTNTNIGNYVKAGLPNITATLPADDYNTYGWAGAFYEGSTVNPATRHLESMSGQYHPVYFDASRCSSIYGKSNTVQPPAVLYRTMIQLKKLISIKIQ